MTYQPLRNRLASLLPDLNQEQLNLALPASIGAAAGLGGLAYNAVAPLDVDPIGLAVGSGLALGTQGRTPYSYAGLTALGLEGARYFNNAFTNTRDTEASPLIAMGIGAGSLGLREALRRNAIGYNDVGFPVGRTASNPNVNPPVVGRMAVDEVATAPPKKPSGPTPTPTSPSPRVAVDVNNVASNPVMPDDEAEFMRQVNSMMDDFDPVAHVNNIKAQVDGANPRVAADTGNTNSPPRIATPAFDLGQIDKDMSKWQSQSPRDQDAIDSQVRTAIQDNVLPLGLFDPDSPDFKYSYPYKDGDAIGRHASIMTALYDYMPDDAYGKFHESINDHETNLWRNKYLESTNAGYTVPTPSFGLSPSNIGGEKSAKLMKEESDILRRGLTHIQAMDDSYSNEYRNLYEQHQDLIGIRDNYNSALEKSAKPRVATESNIAPTNPSTGEPSVVVPTPQPSYLDKSPLLNRERAAMYSDVNSPEYSQPFVDMMTQEGMSDEVRANLAFADDVVNRIYKDTGIAPPAVVDSVKMPITMDAFDFNPNKLNSDVLVLRNSRLTGGEGKSRMVNEGLMAEGSLFPNIVTSNPQSLERIASGKAPQPNDPAFFLRQADGKYNQVLDVPQSTAEQAYNQLINSNRMAVPMDYKQRITDPLSQVWRSEVSGGNAPYDINDFNGLRIAKKRTTDTSTGDKYFRGVFN